MEKLKSFYSTKLLPVLHEFSAHHLELILVGGAVRNFMLDGSFNEDCDLEIVSTQENISLELVKENIEAVLKKIVGDKFERLPYHIYKFALNGLDCEISIGREEEFLSQGIGHKNFKPNFLLNKDFRRKWRRRDFSINAMGINLSATQNPVELIDPFFGKDDITNNVLRPCSDQFYRDPVRLLRLVRFHLLYGLEISETIQIEKFNLSAITFFYLRKEGERTNLSLFLRTLYDMVCRFNILSNEFVQLFGKVSEQYDFVNFHHLIYLLAKDPDNEIVEFIFKNGLFSKKKFNKLRKFNDLKNKDEKKRYFAKELGHLDQEFLDWCRDDL